MEKKEYINEYQKKIAILLHRFGDSVSTRSISKELGIHWNTTKKNLERLEKAKIISKIKLKNKTLWKLNETNK